MIGPQRIVCLTEEPTEVLYALGEQERIVGISGFTVRPPRARREKPRVSAFTSARIDQILELGPDLAIGFSDMQADIAQALIRAGVEVWISNHRSVAGIIAYVERLAALVGAIERGRQYADGLRAHVEAVRRAAAALDARGCFGASSPDHFTAETHDDRPRDRDGAATMGCQARTPFQTWKRESIRCAAFGHPATDRLG